MTKLELSPFSWLEFDADGKVVYPAAVGAIKAMISAPGITDLVLMSHGWRNNKTQARDVYGTLWSNAKRALARDAARIAIIGVLWLSKPHSEDFDVDALEAASDSHALATAIHADGDSRDISGEQFEQVVDDCRATFRPSRRMRVIIAAARLASDGLDSQNAQARDADALAGCFFT